MQSLKCVFKFLPGCPRKEGTARICPVHKMCFSFIQEIFQSIYPLTGRKLVYFCTSFPLLSSPCCGAPTHFAIKVSCHAFWGLSAGVTLSERGVDGSLGCHQTSGLSVSQYGPNKILTASLNRNVFATITQNRRALFAPATYLSTQVISDNEITIFPKMT